MSGDRPSALVTDAAIGSAITVIRSLGRAGWRVVAVDAHRRNPGFRSRYASTTHVVPSPDDDPTASARTVASIAKAEGVDVVMATTDRSIIPLSADRSLLGDGPRLAGPDHGAFEIARDKAAVLESARGLGIAIPETRLATTAGEASRAAHELGWPAVLKPWASHQPDQTGRLVTHPVSIARSAQEVDRLISDEIPYPVLVQRYVEGVGAGVEMLLRDGAPLAAFQHRRLREVPIAGGMSSSRISEPLDPELLDSSTRLLEALSWTGLAMVEYRLGPDGPVLMEINGRVWGSIALAVRAGVDFPLLLANMTARRPLPPASLTTDYAVGVECRNLELELRWLAIAARQGWSRETHLRTVSRREWLGAAAGLVNPRNNFDVQVRGDLGPSYADAARSFATLGASALRMRRQ